MPTKMSHDDFINKSNIIHNGIYNYSSAFYINSHTDVFIVCNIHGNFTQKPYSHLSGKGCNKCAQQDRFDRMRGTKDEFVRKANIKHNNKYDYSEVVYKSTHTKIHIKCDIHGIFTQEPASHLSGIGCPKCGIEKNTLSKIDTVDDFIIKANKIHNNFYNYKSCLYKSSQEKVDIICPTHGLFSQRPNDHLMGHGCPTCCHHISSQQLIIEEYLNKNSINFISSDRTVLCGREIDIFIKEHNIGIEVNGAYWHSEEYREPNFHLKKKIECEKKNINLLHIWDFELNNSPNIVLNRIGSYLGINKKIHARKLVCDYISSSDAKKFCDINHLQKGSYSSINIALKDNTNTIVAIMTFSKSRYDKQYDYELVRYCSLLNHNIIGGASKLLNRFITDNSNKSIISYADRRFTSIDKNLYKSLGFLLKRVSKPSYFWFKNGVIIKRIQSQKHKLISIIDIYDESKTEVENMIINGYKRVYDCGNLVFEIPKIIV
jgi:hypothetical protein